MNIQDSSRFVGVVVFASHLDFPALAAEEEIPYRALKGCFEGVEESCFAVMRGEIGRLVLLGVLAEQKSILYLTAQSLWSGGVRTATLITLDNQRLSRPLEVVPLGEWTLVTETEARAEENWTHDPINGKWWVCRACDNPPHGVLPSPPITSVTL